MLNKLARWLWPRVRCRGCRFLKENYITSLQGQGIYRFSYCGRMPHDTEIVDPDAGRECKFREEDNDGSDG